MNLTKPENEIKLKSIELSSSLNVLVQFVQYNSILNNTAINSTVDQQNVIQVASNLLEEENTNTWLLLQKVTSFLITLRKNIIKKLIKTTFIPLIIVRALSYGRTMASRNVGEQKKRLLITRLL